MLRPIGIRVKSVNITENLYDDTECSVGHITNWFKMDIGVRQGCLLSPTLFNIFLEFMMDEEQSSDHTNAE